MWKIKKKKEEEKWVESKDLWNISKLANLTNVRIQKEEERKKWAERIFEEIMA